MQRSIVLLFDYLTKMPFVKRGYLASALQGRCTNNRAIEANHFPGDLQFGPDTRMLVRGLLCVGDDRQGRQDGARVTLPRHLMCTGPSTYTVHRTKRTQL